MHKNTITSPLVSIIVPVYNGEEFIYNTLHSILSQNYPNIEIIVVNDGSNDNTTEILKKINDSKLRIIDQKNTGVSIARNNGSKHANGKYICFFDADDIMPSDFIKNRVLFLESNPQYDFCCSGYIDIDKNGKILREGGFSNIEKNGINEILLFSPFACSTPSSFLYNYHFLNSKNIKYHPLLSNTADRLFLLQCCKEGKAGFSPLSPFLHSIYTESMSKTMSPKIFIDFDIYVNELKKQNLIPKEIKRASLKKHYRILCGISIKTKKYFFAIKFLYYYLINY